MPYVRGSPLEIASLTEAIFFNDGERFVPTERASSPWGPDVLHGGPPAGLLARAIERARPLPGMMVVRLTVDLFRPVPKVPLEVRTQVVRAGRRIQVVEASLIANGIEVSRAAGLMLHRSDIQLPPNALIDGPPPHGPAGIATTGLSVAAFPPRWEGFHTTIEVRRVSGAPGGGPSAAWIRIPFPLVAGEAMTPLVRVAATSDFGNGLSHIRADGNMGFINADITLYLHREAAGEWICLDAHSGAHTYGIGMIQTAIHDERGPVGLAVQALLANAHSAPAPSSRM